MLTLDVWVVTVLGAGVLLLLVSAFSPDFRRRLLAVGEPPSAWAAGSDVILTVGFVLLGVGLIEVAAGVVDAGVGRTLGRGLPLRKLVLGTSPTVLAAFVVSVLARLRGLTPEKAFGLASRHSTRDVVRGAVVCLAVYPLLMAAFAVWQYVFTSAWGPVAPQEAARTVLARQWWPEAAASVAIAVLVVPLFEEMVFRGFLLSAFLRRMGSAGAVVLSAALFGLLHGVDHVFYAVPVFVLGLILGWLYVRTGRLWVAVGCHGTFNALALVTARLLRG